MGQFWGHGMLYTALSRMRNMQGMKVNGYSERKVGCGQTTRSLSSHISVYVSTTCKYLNGAARASFLPHEHASARNTPLLVPLIAAFPAY